MTRRILAGLLAVLTPHAAWGEEPARVPLIPGLRAQVRLLSTPTQVGKPVWAQFSIENMTDEPITLTVPGTTPEIPAPEMGLPTAHIFSGGGSSALTMFTESGRRIEEPIGYRHTTHAPILIVAPHGSVGTAIDLREYFPMLRGAGQFRLNWKPYGGGAVAENVLVNIATLKQVEIQTDDGKMTLRFFYDEAPETVANFLELARSGFYNGKTFHRLEPGYLIQGGCPRGDGTGIRLDGKRLPAEFGSRPHDKGTVSMALLGDDPDSASCQFFICNTRIKDWDGKYTVFAELTGAESLATLDKLMATPVDEHSRPARGLYIRTVRIVDAPPDAP